MKGLGLLFRFMTRLPIPGEEQYDEAELGRSLKLFPIVGMVIGAILYAVAKGLGGRIDNPYAVAMIVLLVEVVLTGGLHLDGLADTFDGIFSYRSKHRMLEIMKDSRVGTNGVLALVIAFLLKVFLLVEVGPLAALIFPVIGRLNSVVNAAIAPYARPTGMGKALVKHTTTGGIVVATALTVLFMGATICPLGGNLLAWGTSLVASMLGGVYFAKLMERKIGGVTGDTLGAVVELTEILALLVVALF